VEKKLVNNNNVTLMRRLIENHSKTKIYSSLWMSRPCNSKHKEEKKQVVFGVISVCSFQTSQSLRGLFWFVDLRVKAEQTSAGD